MILALYCMLVCIMCHLLRSVSDHDKCGIKLKFSTVGVKVAVNVSSSGKPVLRYMYYVNEPSLTLHMKKNP